MPPYWSLGFHLCRYGYNSIENMKMVRNRMQTNNIPQDVQWNDIDYMDAYRDFTIDNNKFAGLSEFVDDLHEKGMHYVIITVSQYLKSDNAENDTSMSLTHFWSMFPFYTPCKHQKTSGFLMFSGGIKWGH